jgi:hypothetical protein
MLWRVILPVEQLVLVVCTRVVITWQSSRNLAESCGSTVIVVQHAAQALAPLDHAGFPELARCGTDQSVGKPW